MRGWLGCPRFLEVGSAQLPYSFRVVFVSNDNVVASNETRWCVGGCEGEEPVPVGYSLKATCADRATVG